MAGNKHSYIKTTAMRIVYHIFKCSIYFSSVFGYLYDVAEKQQLITTQNLMIWPNATVPFYVNPDHFDHEQSLKILTALSMFAFKTCLKFAPVMALPSSNEHVMVFVNPTGVKRCVFDTQGHSFYEPHLVTLGYDCLNTPHLEMVIMKALGFQFEHNQPNRNKYIDVMLENVESGSTEMFIRDIDQPVELRMLPYDFNSVMHFGTREFSKNGHRTIIFKDPNVEQNRIGLTATDVRKFDIVYGPECLRRDRQEKIELCQSYPNVARRKRETEPKDKTKTEENVAEKKELDPHIVTKSLRVNPHITPPREIVEVTTTLKDLGIEDQVQKIVENVFKISKTALSNARTKYCTTEEKSNVRTLNELETNTDILDIVNLISNYAKGMVDNAVTNITEFCKESDSLAAYERSRCNFATYDPRCNGNYKSTRYGPARYSTKHRPYIPQSTNYKLYHNNKHIYARLRSTNDTAEVDSEVNKQEIVTTKDEGLTLTTEKMKTEKSALRFGATGPPRSRKSLQKHRNVIRKDNRAGHSLVIPSQNFQPQGQPAVFTNGDRGTEEEEEVINVNLQSNEHFKPKNDPKVKEDDDDKTGLQLEEDPNSETRYESDTALNKIVKLSNYHQIASVTPKINKKKRFKIERPHENEEKGKKRHKNNKNRDVKVKFDSGERDNSEIKHQKEIMDEPKVIAQNNDYSEDRHEVKKHKKRQKNIREKETEEDEPKTMVEENDYKEERYSAKKQKKLKENYSNVASNRDKKEKRTEVSVPETITLTKQNREFYKDRKWPGGFVRYAFKSGLGYDLNDVRRRIEEVNIILKERTCVRLKEITEHESEKVEDFILIDDSPDYVTGRVGGKQNFGTVELLQGGQHRQHTAMMIMAMLGFYFEVARHDRDKYIRVHMRHVRADKLHHFEKIRADATLSVPYDYKSATHPAWQFWRQYGRSGISTVATYKETDPDGSLMKSLGQNSELLSETDILKINSIYGVRCFLRKRQKRGRNLKKNNREM